MNIRDIIYIAIILALSVVSIINYTDAQRSKEFIENEMLALKQRRDQQFSVQQQQQNEYQKVLEEYKKQQQEYKALLKEHKDKQDDWVARLQKEKSSSINITDVHRADGDVTIKFQFITKSDSNEFIRLANSLSNIPVVLMKYIGPKENSFGRAEIKISSKHNPLFDMVNESKKN